MIGNAGADWPRAARPVKVTGTNLYGYNSTDQLGLLKYPQVRYGMPIVGAGSMRLEYTRRYVGFLYTSRLGPNHERNP